MEPAAEITSLIDLAAALTEFEQRYTQLARAADTLEKSGEWALDGSTSMAAWLRSHLRMLDSEAHELLRDGRFLGRFPAFSDAVTDTTLSLGQPRPTSPPPPEPRRDRSVRQ
jgi:hypothetical protein